MQKYILIKLLEDVPVGSEFTAIDWPLHLTLVDDFFAGLSETDMRRELNTLLAKQSPVEAGATKDDLRGPLKTVPVTLLEITPDLMLLHDKLIGFLKQHGAMLVSPEFAGHGFKPHVTVQGEDRIATGNTVVIDAISLVAMSPDGRSRLRLLDTIRLSEV